MTHTRKTLPLDDIRIDGGTQARVGISEETVAEYAEHPDGLPPLVVFDDGSVKWLADGFHRYHARRKAGLLEAECEVHDGTREEALWYAIGANKTHGLKRTREDKRRAVQLALEAWGDRSDRAIAEHVGVGHPMVATVRSQVEKSSNSEDDSDSSGDDEPPTGRSSSSKRTGRDGKKRAAPRRPEPSTNGTAPHPPPLRDPFGLPVPPEMLDVFDPALEEKRKELLGIIKQLATLVNEYASSPAGDYIRSELKREGRTEEKVRYVEPTLDEVRRRFEQLAPHCSVCPYCIGKAGKTRKDCAICEGKGWSPAQLFGKDSSVPKSYLEAVEALKEGGEQ